MAKSELNQKINTAIEISIRLLVLFLIISSCLTIVLPFLDPIIWGIIIAIIFQPLHEKITQKLKNNSKIGSLVIILLFSSVLIIPTILVLNSSVKKIKTLNNHIDNGTLTIPPPNEKIKKWPFIGDKSYEVWSTFSKSIEKGLNQYDSKIATIGKWIINKTLGVTEDVFKLFISIIIAGILLATKNVQEFTIKLLNKLTLNKNLALPELMVNTIRTVAKGIIGVTLLQCTVLLILFLLAGVPYAEILAGICLIFGIIQLPPTLVGVPVAIYLYSSLDTTPATIWSILIILTCLSDKVLQPIFLGKGSKIPMIIVFIGATGGFMARGFFGLFMGAIILSLGYVILMKWLNTSVESD